MCRRKGQHFENTTGMVGFKYTAKMASGCKLGFRGFSLKHSHDLASREGRVGRESPSPLPSPLADSLLQFIGTMM